MNINESCIIKTNLLLFHRNVIFMFSHKKCKCQLICFSNFRCQKEASFKVIIVKEYFEIKFFFSESVLLLSIMQFLIIFLFKCRQSPNPYSIHIFSDIKQFQQEFIHVISSTGKKVCNTFKYQQFFSEA